MAKVQTCLDSAMHQQKWPVSFSVGVVTFTTPPASTDEMVKRADELMHHDSLTHRDPVLPCFAVRQYSIAASVVAASVVAASVVAASVVALSQALLS